MDRKDNSPDKVKGVKRRGLLRFGSLVSAISGAVVLTGTTTSAVAAPGDKNLSSYVPTAEKGAPLGVATLDNGTKIPSTQIPDLSESYARAISAQAWKPFTFYSTGTVIASPAGSLVKARIDHQSNIEFQIGDWLQIAPAALMPRYYDEGGRFVDRGAILTLSRNHDPSGFQPLIWANVAGQGDNKSFKGVVAGQFLARDRFEVDSTNKGVLYAIQAVVAPTIDRDNIPYDDVVGLSIVNQGTAMGTDGLYFGNNRMDRATNPDAKDFANVIQNDMSSNSFIRSIGRHDVGISLSGAKITTTAIRLGNSQSISWNDELGNLTHAIRLSAKGTLRLLEGGIDIRSDKSVYFNNKVVLSNNTPLYGLRFGAATECEVIKVATDDNVALFGGRVKILASGGIALQGSTSQPAAQASGAGALFVEAGALKYRGSLGTVTTIAPA
ncbi:hypothetical protein SAMN04489743_3397 [Pseudarthrobacter equi]|uniref:Uncharacterized protein n=1 Tax=Pseudarthrobacter equi TaxID=728066 RepID=A0A1H2B4I5_9MICC|nr:hypothetical protein [Pseudarthrobacter equi]SDT52696.1 hypothetical protein SAMN04489743_3397 [Pseudarthrobacter equi]